MTSTDVKTSITSSTRPSSRVLKPPGGGHTNIFAEPEPAVIAPRPKYNQQNSSNLNACMGSTDPNRKVEQLRGESSEGKNADQKDESSITSATPKIDKGENANTNGNNNGAGSRGRVPPGGFSSGGFW